MSRPVKELKPHLRLDPVTRRALLVEAAAEVFRDRDPTEVSFEEVAEAGGVSRSLVYAYFGDRGGLIAAVYLHNLQQLDDQVGMSLGGRMPDRLELRRLIRHYLRFARDNPASWSLMAAASAIQHPAVQEVRRSRIERIADAWASEPATRLIARGVVGMLEAGAQEWVDHRDCGIERATDILLAVLWDGLAGLGGNGIPAAS